MREKCKICSQQRQVTPLLCETCKSHDVNFTRDKVKKLKSALASVQATAFMMESRKNELENAINKTLKDNPNLADGDDCTLIDLVQVMERQDFAYTIKSFKFLPDCKWQGDDGKNGSVTYCYKDGHEQQGKPCSKRCENPEPKESDGE